MTIAIEAVGWVGSALVLAAYLLVSIGKLSARSAVFQWMNFVGAAGLGVNAFWHGALPPAALDIAWAVIGLVALVQIARRRNTA